MDSRLSHWDGIKAVRRNLFLSLCMPLETSGRSCSSTAPCPVSACAATGTAPPSSAAASPSAWARVFVRGACGIIYCRTYEREKQREDV